MEEEGAFVCLNLFPENWRLPDEEFVAFGVAWCNPFTEQWADPYVFLRVPLEDAFQGRNRLLNLVRLPMIDRGFEDDGDPYYPICKYLDAEEFQSASGFDADGFAAAAVEGLRDMLPMSELIDKLFASPCVAPPPRTKRLLKTVAFVDTETSGNGNRARMTELAIINAAYDEIGDEIVERLEEYSLNAPTKLDETKTRSMLAGASAIVAHNAEFDRGVLERVLPGVEKLPWLDSCHGIDWKGLTGTDSASLESLLSLEGLAAAQQHTALADAHDLLRLLAVQRDGKTYLARLLNVAKPIAAAAGR